jgi:hypothetical protein
MSHVHVIGDLFLAEFLPVESFISAEGPAYRVIALSPNEPARSYSSLGGSARVAALLAPYVDDLTLYAPIPASSEIAALIATTRTRAGRQVIVKSPRVRGSNTRILRSYSRASTGQWGMVLRVEYPEYLEVETASEVTTSGVPETATASPAETVVVGDFGHGFVTEDLLRGSLTPAARVILYAGHLKANDFGMLGGVREAIVICSDNLALRWTSLSDPPARLPDDEPVHYLNLLATMLAALKSRFATVKHFVVTCQPLTQRCFVFAHDVSSDSWLVYYCHLTEAITPSADAPPGAKTAFVASLAQSLLQSDQEDLTRQVIQGALRGIACVSYLSDQGVGSVSGSLGRVETLPDSLPTSATTELVGNVGSALLVAPIRDSHGLLGRAALHGRLPAAPEVLPGYYVPASAQDGVRGFVEALGTYLSKVSHRRPFNVLLSAAPGSGKSYFVECLVRRLRALSVENGRGEDLHPLIEVNLSAVESVGAFEEQLLDVYNDIRDERAAGRIPVVMLDEFDSLLHQSDSNGKREGAMNVVLAKMLSPLWDGVFATAKKTRRLGGFVLIMVVSDEQFLQKLDVGKGKDFESRLDISCKLPAPSGVEEEFESKVRVALAMLAKHFGEGVEFVELAVLEAVGRATFARRNRGIDQLFLLSKQPLDRVFRLGHLAPLPLRSERIVAGLDVEAAANKFGTGVIRCR